MDRGGYFGVTAQLQDPRQLAGGVDSEPVCVAVLRRQLGKGASSLDQCRVPIRGCAHARSHVKRRSSPSVNTADEVRVVNRAGQDDDAARCTREGVMKHTAEGRFTVRGAN